MGKYHRPNTDYNKKTKTQAGSAGWWEPQRGGQKNTIRVMPPWDDQGICIIRRVLHYGLEDDGRARAFPCLADNLPWLPKRPCPLDHLGKKLAAGDSDEREIAKDLSPSSPRFLVQLVDCKNPDNGVQKYAGPLSFGRYFLSLLEDEDLEDLTDPEKGYDLIMEITGKGRGTKYDYRIRPKSSKIIYKDWSSELEDLIKTIEVKSASELIELAEENYGNVIDLDSYMKDFDEGEGVSQDEPWYTKKDIKKMGKDDLLELVDEQELDIEDEDWASTRELKEIIIEEMDLD